MTYKILGADQKEYGPVSSEQIAQWIREGRANAQTLVQDETSPEWRPLSTFPELTAFMAEGPPPVEAAPGPEMDPRQLAEFIKSRGRRVNIGSCLSRGWALFKQNAGLLIGAALVAFLTVAVIEGLLSVLLRPAGFSRNQMQFGFHFTQEMFVRMAVGSIPSFLVYPALYAGYYFLVLKLIRGQSASVADLFTGFRFHYLQIVVAGFLTGILALIGTLLCIIPGIYLGVAWIFTLPLIVDRDLGFWEAMELGRKAVTQDWWSVFCVVLLLGGLAILGFLACCIGLFVAIPVGVCMLMYAYEDIFPPPSPRN